jgi:arsenate reductase (thioredoxin)
MKRTFLLFLCIHNSARSQMAEGLLRHLLGDHYRAFSAGTEATAVHPLALLAMEKAGIDITKQWSKTVDELAGKKFNVVVTVCAEGAEACPFVPGVERYVHWSIPDPAAATGTEAEKLLAFIKTRDKIKRLIMKTFG